MNAHRLSESDIYALARAFVGMTWEGVALSPWAQLVLKRLDLNTPADVSFLRRMLGPAVLQAVLAVDPNSPPPPSGARCGEVNTVPELPVSAQLTSAQREQGDEVGHWLDEYVTWSSGAANETPLRFHEGAGLWLVALAIGRRLYVDTPWGQKIHPNLYVMLVAVSTYYRKSAGLNLAHEVARAAMPHMLLPQPGSPEAFMSMLGGVLPGNFEDIAERDRERLLKGNRFAAQRGILRDELSRCSSRLAETTCRDSKSC